MKMTWFILAIIGLFIFAGMTLVQKHLLNLGIHPVTFGLYIMGFSFVGFVLTTLVTKQAFVVPGSWIPFLVLVGVLSVFGTIVAAYAFKLASNPGYVIGGTFFV
jgi:drug/metabolite transporter (DMT)-like permease